VDLVANERIRWLLLARSAFHLLLLAAPPAMLKRKNSPGRPEGFFSRINYFVGTPLPYLMGLFLLTAKPF
jgi:hypothetical protein